MCYLQFIPVFWHVCVKACVFTVIFSPSSTPSKGQSQSTAPTPSTGPNSPFLPETPIQFDLCSSEDQNGATVNKSLPGPPKLVPFLF